MQHTIRIVHSRRDRQYALDRNW